MKWNKELQVYFKSLNVEVTFYPSGTVKKFSSIERFYAYYTSELEHWNKQNNHFTEIKTYFQNIYDNLIETNNYIDLDNIKNHLDITIDIAKNNSFPNIPSSSQLASFLIDLQETNINNILKFLFIYLKNQFQLSSENATNNRG